MFQSATATANLPAVLAARSALVMVSPFGTPIGDLLVGALGASETLAASGVATVALAIAASIVSAEVVQEPTVKRSRIVCRAESGFSGPRPTISCSAQ